MLHKLRAAIFSSKEEANEEVQIKQWLEEMPAGMSQLDVAACIWTLLSTAGKDGYMADTPDILLSVLNVWSNTQNVPRAMLVVTANSAAWTDNFDRVEIDNEDRTYH